MNLWIFDVDGVLTNPIIKKVTEPELLRIMYALLKAGNPIAINTGRSLSWLEERLLAPFSEIVQDKTHLKDVFISCEKGNVLATYNDGKWEKKLLDYALPESLIKTIKKMVDEEFSEAMFFDDSKETMISVEMKDGFDNATFTKLQEILHKKVSKLLLSNEYMNLELIIDASQISLDIQYEDAGKHLGAERIEDWMLSKELKPEIIYMLGDSPSDLEMAEELQSKYQVIFVFVNDRHKLNAEKLTCEVVYTSEKFTKGTLEFLKNNT